MSEIKKNIETCRGEDVLAEVSALPQDPHFGSLVNEALDPMQQQALHQAGYDGYSEVIAQHKPYTFASAIVQMKSNLLLLLRALWQFPFGSGTLRSLSDDASLRSLSDMWQHYITRLQGSETYGIPSRLSSLTDLPSAPLLVADRKISGVPDAVDGMSMVHLCCENATAAEVLSLTDSNHGWTANKANILQTLMGIFDSARTFTLNCKTVTAVLVGEFYNTDREYDIYFPELDDIGDQRVIGTEYVNRNPTFNVHLDALKTSNQTTNTYSSFYARRIYIPNYEKGVYRQGGSASYSNPHTTYMLVGCKGAKTELVRVWSYYDQSSLVDFEISEGACMSITLQGFPNLTAENMYNHILCRLKQDEAGCGSGVTITLGSTNIAKLEAVEEYNTLLTELEDVYGYTFA